MKTQVYSLLASAILNTSCGAKSSSDGASAASTAPSTAATASTAQPDSSLLLSDSGAASQAITSHIDVALGAVAEEPADSSGAAALVSAASSSVMERYRNCAVDAATAVVTIDQSVERDHFFTGPKRTYESKYARYLEKTRTWSRSGGDVTCDSGDKYADIQIPMLAGVSLDATLKDTRSRTQTLTNKANPNGLTVSSKEELDGSRHVDWKTVTPTATSYQIAKESTHTGTSTLNLQKKDGTMVTLTASVATASGAPFAILVERDKSTLALLTRTIQSGTLEATHKDGTRVETVFKQVVYTDSSDDKCMATAGEIDGSIFAPSATTAGLTFVITFGDDPTITFSNGTTAAYVQAGCELDEPSTGATEAASKTAVTAPAAATPAAT